jgi:copper homeostasis protein
MTTGILIEACVESAEAAVAAAEAGVGRVELCENLVEGGTTPSAGTIALTVERLAIPVFVMIRPRGGDFVYTDLEFAIMRRDIGVARDRGAAGLVFGLLEPDGTIDRDRTTELIEAARPLPVTFHRAFDVTRDPLESLETLIELGVDRLLTSGQQPRAVDALPLLRRLVVQAGDQLVVMIGGAVDAENGSEIIRRTGARELHAWAPTRFASPMRFRNPDVPMGRSYEPEDYIRFTANRAEFSRLVASVRAL